LLTGFETLENIIIIAEFDMLTLILEDLECKYWIGFLRFLWANFSLHRWRVLMNKTFLTNQLAIRYYIDWSEHYLGFLYLNKR